MNRISRVVATIIVIAVLPRSAAAQFAAREHARVQVGMSIGVFSITDLSRAPACEQLTLSCSTSLTKPETALFGGGLWAAVHVAPRVAIAVEWSAYDQPWPDGTVDASGRKAKNHVGFFLAGPKRIFAERGSDLKRERLFGQVQAGLATADHLPDGLVATADAGIEGFHSCRSGAAQCIHAISLGYRRVAGAAGRYLSGFRSVMRLGWTF